MKIKKIELTEKDKIKAYRAAVRNSMVESGINQVTKTRIHKNKKKYSRKRRNSNLSDDLQRYNEENIK